MAVGTFERSQKAMQESKKEGNRDFLPVMTIYCWIKCKSLVNMVGSKYMKLQLSQMNFRPNGIRNLRGCCTHNVHCTYFVCDKLI